MLNTQVAHRVLGSVLLVAGCCIGAGMLGLPLVTRSAGFFPCIAAFIVSWLFMATTGLLLLEANLWFEKGVNLMTLAERTLGKAAKVFVVILFAFLFYCLMVAYLGGGGALISEFCEHFLGMHVNPYLGSLILTAVFALVLFCGTAKVDLFNRLLMIGLGISYAGLVYLGIFHIHPENLKAGSFACVAFALPAMIISFGYHNLVPSLRDYLEGNVGHLKIAILAGSGIPLIIYLLWNAIVLGILPPNENFQEAVESGAMVTSLFREAVGHASVVYLMHAFAFFALVTSFLAIALSFVDFLADGLKVKKTSLGTLLLLSLVLVPPLACAYFYPAIFLTALNYAGAFGAVLLFGIIPVLMVWKGRYAEGRNDLHLVPGGKPVLLLIGAFALSVFLMQFVIEFA